MTKKKTTLLNVISSILVQVFTTISGIIVPRLILSNFGSEVNGLISSASQFLSYITLIEGGIGSVILANLYKPLVERNVSEMSSVVVTAGKFYKKIGLIFVGYSVILSGIYPIIFKTGFSYAYVSTLIFIVSIVTAIQYMFAINIRTLLSADKRIYVVSFVQIVSIVLNIVLSVLALKIFPSIHFMKIMTVFAYLLQPLFFRWYVKKKYDVDWKAKVNNDLIKERWNGFAINVAAFIHNSTDIAVLTIFTDLKIVSVYSVYYLVTNGIKQIIISITNALNPSIGQSYAKGDLNEINEKLNMYEYIVMILTFSLFTMTALLITPFAMIYTQGVADTNYYQPTFGYLLVISEVLYIVKFPHLNLAYSANKFKELTYPACFEAGINIILSVFLVCKFGIVGVVIGTIVAMVYRMIFHVYYTSKLIPGRKQWLFYKKLFFMVITSLSAFAISSFCFPIDGFSILSWLQYAIIYAFVVGISMFLISIIVFKKDLHAIILYLRMK